MPCTKFHFAATSVYKISYTAPTALYCRVKDFVHCSSVEIRFFYPALHCSIPITYLDGSYKVATAAILIQTRGVKSLFSLENSIVDIYDGFFKSIQKSNFWICFYYEVAEKILRMCDIPLCIASAIFFRFWVFCCIFDRWKMSLKVHLPSYLVNIATLKICSKYPLYVINFAS